MFSLFCRNWPICTGARIEKRTLEDSRFTTKSHCPSWSVEWGWLQVGIWSPDKTLLSSGHVYSAPAGVQNNVESSCFAAKTYTRNTGSQTNLEYEHQSLLIVDDRFNKKTQNQLFGVWCKHPNPIYATTPPLVLSCLSPLPPPTQPMYNTM